MEPLSGSISTPTCRVRSRRASSGRVSTIWRSRAPTDLISRHASNVWTISGSRTAASWTRRTDPGCRSVIPTTFRSSSSPRRSKRSGSGRPQGAQRGAVGPRRRVAGTKAMPGALVGDAPARQLLGGASRRDAVRAGQIEHAADGVGDLGGALPGLLAVVADELLGEVDDPAGVHHEVRRVEDPARGEVVVIGR